MTADDRLRAGEAVAAEHERTAHQIAELERAVAAIIEGSELTSTDDEHDPEGATIAYERAQAMALLQQARTDLARLDDALARLESGGSIVCTSCGRNINIERLLALPAATTCVSCAP